MTKYITLLSLLFIMSSCTKEPKTTTQTTVDQELTYTSFGEEINLEDAITYPELLNRLSTEDSVTCKVTGIVQDVCQVKGCWMTMIDPSDDDKPELFVKFKDYGFFMPLDISGKTVTMEGTAYTEITSVEDLKHYAEDNEATQEEIDAITEPEEELKFMANGVLLRSK